MRLTSERRASRLCDIPSEVRLARRPSAAAVDLAMMRAIMHGGTCAQYWRVGEVRANVGDLEIAWSWLVFILPSRAWGVVVFQRLFDSCSFLRLFRKSTLLPLLKSAGWTFAVLARTLVNKSAFYIRGQNFNPPAS